MSLNPEFLSCNVHWHSDVAEGRFIGAAAVAHLHADPAFQAELAAQGTWL
jgi:acid phosphatase (class A)